MFAHRENGQNAAGDGADPHLSLPGVLQGRTPRSDIVDADVRVESRQLVRGAVVVSVVGEIDLDSASNLRRELTRVEDGPGTVVVDLSAANFSDSLTLGILVGTARRIRQRGGELRIVCAHANITRIFELTLLDRLLDIYASRAAALEVVPGAP